MAHHPLGVVIFSSHWESSVTCIYASHFSTPFLLMRWVNRVFIPCCIPSWSWPNEPEKSIPGRITALLSNLHCSSPKDRANSLAHAVSGEVKLYEDVANFQPEKGAILANATPLGMHPNTDRIPVAEVLSTSIQTRTIFLNLAFMVKIICLHFRRPCWITSLSLILFTHPEKRDY